MYSVHRDNVTKINFMKTVFQSIKMLNSVKYFICLLYPSKVFQSFQAVSLTKDVMDD